LPHSEGKAVDVEDGRLETRHRRIPAIIMMSSSPDANFVEALLAAPVSGRKDCAMASEMPALLMVGTC
jgi:hypothetical protein